MYDLEVNEQGIIISLGKFEGEPSYVPYFWYIDGEDDQVDLNGQGVIARIFYVSRSETKSFPDLDDGDVIYLWEDDEGFVRHARNPE